MHPLIEDNLEAIRVLCRVYGIEKLEVFGSIMTGEFREDSDVDFIVHLPEGYDFGPWASRYQDFAHRLRLILGRDVDVVMASAVRKPRFIDAIADSRTLLYAA